MEADGYIVFVPSGGVGRGRERDGRDRFALYQVDREGLDILFVIRFVLPRVGNRRQAFGGDDLGGTDVIGRDTAGGGDGLADRGPTRLGPVDGVGQRSHPAQVARVVRLEAERDILFSRRAGVVAGAARGPRSGDRRQRGLRRATVDLRLKRHARLVARVVNREARPLGLAFVQGSGQRWVRRAGNAGERVAADPADIDVGVET